jgi:hypothetical protein
MLPASYEPDRNLPTIYLIDFAEQHFKLATDEFEKVIAGVGMVEGLEGVPTLAAARTLCAPESRR